MSEQLLFSTGTARGGTGLVTRMLSVSQKAEIALDPYMELFKVLRKSILLASDFDTKNYDFSKPFSDYYFSGEKFDELRCILNTDLSVQCEVDPTTKERIKRRITLSSGDLLSSVDELIGTTGQEVFQSALDIIYKVRNKDLSCLGWHENWIVEFFPALARSFESAKFLIVLRDPRAVINSSLNVSDPSLRGQVLSYSRSLRKTYALSFLLQQQDLFKDRLRVVRFEDVVSEPEKKCRELCEFLDIEFLDDMLETDAFIEPSTGGVYNGFSSFEERARGFSPERVNRWRTTLDQQVAKLVEYLIAPEMTLWNYDLEHASDVNEHDVFLELMRDVENSCSWRVDFCDLQKDFGYEQFRNMLRTLPAGSVTSLDRAVIDKSFLDKAIYDAVRS
jgi:hypothetical protein